MNARLQRAILFDLDDTIIDDSSNVREGWLAAVEGEAAVLGGLAPAGVVSAVNEVREWYWANPDRHRGGRADLRAASTWIVTEALRRLGFDDPEVGHRIAHHYRDLREAARSLFPGALETLERVRGLGIATALLTNGDSIGQRAKIDQFGLARYFDYICIEGEFGCGKPDERVYRSALEGLACAPGDAWMIGDNLEWDVAAPMRMGISGIWHDRFKAGLPDPCPVVPDRIVYGIAELLPA